MDPVDIVAVSLVPFGGLLVAGVLFRILRARRAPAPRDAGPTASGSPVRGHTRDHHPTLSTSAPRFSDDPDERLREERFVATIQEGGWVAVVVAKDEDRPGFCYTVGLFETLGHPELVVVGLSEESATMVLEELVARVRAGQRFEREQMVSGIMQHDCTFRVVRPELRDVFLPWARWYYYGHSYPALQFVYPDVERRWPWDPAASDAFRWHQPDLATAPRPAWAGRAGQATWPLDDLKRGLDVALNEATLHELELRADAQLVAITLSVLWLPAGDGAMPTDPRVQLICSGVGRVAASLRHGPWDDPTAPVQPLTVEDLADVVRSLARPVYGWKFVDVADDKLAAWAERISLEWRGPNGGGAQRSLALTLDGAHQFFGVCVWFDDIQARRADGTPLPLDELTAGSWRWWNAFYRRDARTQGAGLIAIDDGPPPADLNAEPERRAYARRS